MLLKFLNFKYEYSQELLISAIDVILFRCFYLSTFYFSLFVLFDVFLSTFLSFDVSSADHFNYLLLLPGFEHTMYFVTVQLVIHSIRLPLKWECMKYTVKLKTALLNKLLLHKKN